MKALLVTLGDPLSPTGGYLYHRRMAEAASAHDASLSLVALPDRGFPTTALSGRWSIRRMLETDIDVLVIDSIAAWAMASLGGRMPRVPTAAMVHQPPGGIDGGVVRRRIQAPLDLLAYRRASLLMVASQSLESELSALRRPGRRIELVPPGCDVEEPDTVIQPDELRRGRHRAFVCVGNWLPRKGILELLEAFARVDDHIAVLHLIGSQSLDHAYATAVRDRMSQSDLRGRVIAHGPLPKATVAAIYRASDAFVLASFIEPYGTVYGEAMAAGLPVIGWHAGNLPNLVRHGVEGLTVAVGDIASLASALQRMASDDELTAGLSRGALQRAAQLPTWEETADRFFQYLRELRDPAPRSEN